jgi:hypothetical protein
MHQIIDEVCQIIAVIALVGAVALLWAVFYLIVSLIKRQPLIPLVVEKVSPSAEEPKKCAPAPVAKSKEAPGISCGHCGMRNKSDPVAGIVIDKDSYNVYVCPVCRQKTLLPIKSA